MPRLVDHAERRRVIVSAACRLIAARGIDATNMRDLAREAGYTNGALSHYYSGKNEILRAAFEHVYEATNARIQRTVGQRRGMTALRRLCREVMPQTEETLAEARIAVSLWQRALNDPQMGSVNTRALQTWRAELVEHLREAREDGELGGVDEHVLANLLMTTMVGLQVTGVLEPEAASPTDQEAMLDMILDGARRAGSRRRSGKGAAKTER